MQEATRSLCLLPAALPGLPVTELGPTRIPQLPDGGCGLPVHQVPRGAPAGGAQGSGGDVQGAGASGRGVRVGRQEGASLDVVLRLKCVRMSR